jgi:hypothetical protein
MLQPPAKIISIQTQSKTADPFSLLESGEIILEVAKFRLQTDIARIINEKILSSMNFMFDELNPDMIKDCYFLPLGMKSTKVDFPIVGILVEQDTKSITQSVYKRIAYIRANEIGLDKDYGSCFEEWIPPPWPEEMLKTIVLV